VPKPWKKDRVVVPVVVEVDKGDAQIFAHEMSGLAPSVDLHAMDREDAGRALDQFIHHHILHRTPVVKIIHGRGTGVLREMTHNYLRASDLVSFFRDAHHVGETGGVTYVVLEITES